MHSNVFGAALAFLVGAGLAAAGYGLDRRTLRTAPEKYAVSHIAKQAVNVLFLAALLVFGGRTPWDRLWLLGGGALGITLPMIWFTYKLVKLNDSLHEEKEDSDNG